MYKTIPQELISLDQWVGWKKIIEERDDRIRKVPINPLNGKSAQANNASTWGSFTAAVKAVDEFELDGIGIMFTNDIFGIDIDHCIENGVVAEFAAEIIEEVRSYTELSPSGTGIHILCRGTLPPGRRRKGAVEMYSSGRFFTVTGKQCGESYPFEDCSERIKTMHSKYLGGGEKAQSASTAPTHSDTTVSMLVADVLNEKEWQAGEIEALAKTVQILQAENERLNNFANSQVYLEIQKNIALQAQIDNLSGKTSPNKPLTLEQLQKMIGEPVYMVDRKRAKESGWCIVEKHYNGNIALFKPDNTYYTSAITTGEVLVYKCKIELEDIPSALLGFIE